MKLSVSDLSFTYENKQIVENVSFQLREGEFVSLLGPSGSGKSTILNMLAGILAPERGRIQVDGGEIRGVSGHFAYMPQDDLLFSWKTILENVCLYGSIHGHLREAKEEALKNFEAFGLAGYENAYPASLSGGMRQRAAFLRTALCQADILLLDEPTNYLDAEHIEWLKRYLNDYENAFILISHDVPFLNSVVNLIYHMENRTLTRYVGDYDKFQEVYAARKAQIEAAYNRQQKEIADLKDFVARNKARVATRNMAMSRQKKLDKMDVIELAGERPKPEFHFKEARTPSRFLFTTTDLIIGYDEPLSSPLNLSMERGQKIVLTGANGIGKTTLLKSILGLIPPLSGSVEQGDYLSIGYFEQELPPDISTTCIQEIWNEFPGFTQYEVRSALAKCGLTTKHIESLVKVLSGGEQAKVRLCKLINRETNLLLLDEPTNHLDVDAKAELKRALNAYKGSILMVCHEPDFYDGLATDVWDCTKWTTKIL